MTNTTKQVRGKFTERMFLEAVVELTNSIENLPVIEDGLTINDKACALLDALDARNERRKAKQAEGPSKTEIENAPLREKVVEYLTEMGGNFQCTATQIAERLDLVTAKGKPNAPKATALLATLVKQGTVEQVFVGKSKPFEYKLA